MRVALLGLEGVGGDYLSALREHDGFDLVAVGEAKSEVLRRVGDGLAAGLYEDYRSLIVEQAVAGLDLLIVALEPFQSGEFLLLAAKQGISVLHKAPFARSVSEARRLLAAFDGADATLTVARPLLGERAFVGLGDPALLVGGVRAADVRVRVQTTGDGWRGDARRAGGGVLLNGAYEQLDWLLAMMGVPETVFAQSSEVVAPGAAKNYDTEDVAMLSLRFSGGRVATLTAARGMDKNSWQIELIGSDGVVRIEPSGLSVTARHASRPRRRLARTPNAMVPVLDSAGAPGKTRGPVSRAADHLETLAVIEAAYLSARTGAVELPSRFLGQD